MIDVSWAGKIPSHWDVVPLKSKFNFSKGLSITKADLVDTGCPVLSYGQIHSKNNAKTGIVGELLRFVPDSITDGCSESLAVKNGFIFADTSEDLDGCGNCTYVDQNGIYAGYHLSLIHIFGRYGIDDRYNRKVLYLPRETFEIEKINVYYAAFHESLVWCEVA